MAQRVIHLPFSAEVHVRNRNIPFVVDTVAMGRILLRGLRVSPVSIISPLLHINLYLQLFSVRQGGEP